MFKIHPAFMKLSLFVGLAFALPTNTQSQTFLSQQEALRGLEAFYVVVEGVKEDARRDGLSQQRLQAVTELTLRSAGISVQSPESIHAKFARDPRFRQAYLYVRVSAKKHLSGLYVYCIEVDLREIIRLVDDSGLTYGAIWDGGEVGTVGHDNLPNVVETVREYIETFASDYLAANLRNQ